uniref:Alpha-1,3-arabinosyltransferase XAT3-like n=2 Tax=Elaeis guineensis var. tenera TaxID=51953 RepID=A0A6I9RR43_ELAGV|nr:alpha-1,3-arabinosyltransferase XAT3-like [Elaeis guineensis]
MIGDVRTHSPSSSIFLYSSSNDTNLIPQEEKIKPYTRKWEGPIMVHIDELHLRTIHSPNASLPCDVHHNVPALFFSAGGYTGNVFHAFNNGLLPLYITSHHLQRQLVLVVLQYRHWWFTKYQEILAQLSEYTPIDFSNDSRIHCFPSAIVGLHFHGTLAVNPTELSDNKSITDFHCMLDKAYKSKVEQIPSQNLKERSSKPPKLVIVSRDGTRVIENEAKVSHLAEEIGFDVEVLKPGNMMAMERIYRSLSSCDVMMGVHGAALTHFLFMRPGSSMFIQIVPLGIEQLAWSCFGEAAIRMGLRYEEYRILPRESSLYWMYGGDDPVVKDPNGTKAKGWEMTKEVYLEGQNVTLDLGRLKKTLVGALQYVVSKRRY